MPAASTRRQGLQRRVKKRNVQHHTGRGHRLFVRVQRGNSDRRQTAWLVVVFANPMRNKKGRGTSLRLRTTTSILKRDCSRQSRPPGAVVRKVSAALASAMSRFCPANES